MTPRPALRPYSGPRRPEPMPEAPEPVRHEVVAHGPLWRCIVDRVQFVDLADVARHVVTHQYDA